MKRIHALVLGGALLVAGTAFATNSILHAQDDGHGAPDMAAMMEEMMKLARPGAEHEALASLVGDWEQTFKYRMGADAPWMDGTGTMTAKAILGGRYVVQESKMSIMGMEMDGMNLLGFDNRKQEFINLWADTMSTWWVTSSGKARADGTIETKGTMIDVAGERPFRMVIQPREDGTVYSEMFDTIPPAGEVKVMEITAKKKS